MVALRKAPLVLFGMATWVTVSLAAACNEQLDPRSAQGPRGRLELDDATAASARIAATKELGEGPCRESSEDVMVAPEKEGGRLHHRCEPRNAKPSRGRDPPPPHEVMHLRPGTSSREAGEANKLVGYECPL